MREPKKAASVNEAAKETMGETADGEVKETAEKQTEKMGILGKYAAKTEKSGAVGRHTEKTAAVGHQKKVVWIASILAVVLVLVLAIAAIYRYLAPSSVQKDLNTVFDLGGNEVALIVDDILREEKGLVIGDEFYVPEKIASKYMDQRIFVDSKEAILSYATSGGLIRARADGVAYTLGKEGRDADKAILTKQGDTFFVSFSFIKEHMSCYAQAYRNPSRLFIMSDRGKTYSFGAVNTDTRLRTGPGKKYPYLLEVPEGSRVIIETGTKQENEYMAVTTEEGITGYVPVERVLKGEERTWEFDRTPESFEQKGIGKKVCLGWHQVTNEAGSASLPSGLPSAACLNVLSPTWFALSDNQGNYTSLANADYVAQAHAGGRQVWGLVNDFGKKLKLSKILGVTSTRTKLVNSLVGSAIQNDLDGINIDFENVTKDNAAAYLEFLRELTIKCHTNDLVVSVDNYTPASYNTFYDLEEQGRVVDYVILMAYDEHYSGSEKSGSVSSLGFVKKGVEDMLAKVPKERMITALPFYTRLWKEVKTKSGVKMSPPTAYGMSGAESVLKSHDVTPEWDDKTGQYYAQYKADGATYKIWLEEETSLKKKLEVVKKNDVAGVAFWKLGFERPATWVMIGDMVK